MLLCKLSNLEKSDLKVSRELTRFILLPLSFMSSSSGEDNHVKLQNDLPLIQLQIFTLFEMTDFINTM